jgi:regulatory protein YycH of two-component signal transduction system YycFG
LFAKLERTDSNFGNVLLSSLFKTTSVRNNENQIQVTWGEKGVFDYRRSLLRTDVVLNSEDNKTNVG